jgi:predicted O-methyltransferase YrrM
LNPVCRLRALGARAPIADCKEGGREEEAIMNKQLILDSHIEALLDRLYAQSSSQSEEMMSYFTARAEAGDIDWNAFDKRASQFLSDKLVALDRAKAEFCYQVCRALRATRVVEAGTSFGVSTLFLAAAVRANLHADGGEGIVIGTEYEPEKAKAARANFAEAGLSDLIELREGDLHESLADVSAPIDFMLIDIWTPMARPALELVTPCLRAGGVVICDNTAQFRGAYRDYFEFINDPANGLRTMTLPFEGGLEFTVRGD